MYFAALHVGCTYEARELGCYGFVQFAGKTLFDEGETIERTKVWAGSLVVCSPALSRCRSLKTKANRTRVHQLTR